YRGLAILTTNQKDAIDGAFLRRIRFIVRFPLPDIAQRTEIWRRIFPAETPCEGLRAHDLARLNLSGGNIRNVALNAAFLAADAGRGRGVGEPRAPAAGRGGGGRGMTQGSRPPRAIEVHIAELIVHGGAPGDRDGIADAVRTELGRLLAASPLPHGMTRTHRI